MMKTYTLIIKTCLLLLLMIVAMGCNSDEPVTLNDFDAERNKMVTSKINYPVYLTGFVYFPSFAVKEQRVIVSKEMFKIPVTATLTKVSKDEYIMVAEAVFISSMTYTIDVKITPGGIVSFTWPETVMINGVEYDSDISYTLLDHDGSIKFGPEVDKFKGNFDGYNFYAKSHFMMKQVQPGALPFYSQLPLIDGPIMIDYATFELVVQ